jgi:transcriptional regulator GlxA family with amidase domain
VVGCYGIWQAEPVARKTKVAGIAPRPHTPRLVAVIAFDGVVLADLSTACELFGLARGADGSPAYEVRVCGLTSRVESRYASLVVPWRLASLRAAHTVLVPGVERLDCALPSGVLRGIRAAVDRGARVASICSGAFVLAATGALDGLKATTHWACAAELARRHPLVEVDPDVLYVDNGRILTSAGAAAGFDLCLHMVRQDLGAERAAFVARAAVMPLERTGGQAQFIAHEQAPRDATSMGALLAWLDQNLSGDLSLAAIARRAAMSARSLSRHFRARVGTTPALWVARARVRRAQRVLETTDHSIERIAMEVGFGSATVLRAQFAEVVGTSPHLYRRQFHLRAVTAERPLAARGRGIGGRQRCVRSGFDQVPAQARRASPGRHGEKE